MTGNPWTDVLLGFLLLGGTQFAGGLLVLYLHGRARRREMREARERIAAASREDRYPKHECDDTCMTQGCPLPRT